MLLNPPEDREPLRLKAVIVWPLRRDLEEYRHYYAEVYGRSIEEADLLVDLGLHAIESDAAFRRWQKKRRKLSRRASPEDEASDSD